MKFRNGLLIGLGVGYYFGARAGRERYAQIERVLDRVRTAPQYIDARGKVADLYADGRERTLSLIDERTGGAASSLLDIRGDDLDMTTSWDTSAFDATDLYDEPTA